MGFSRELRGACRTRIEVVGMSSESWRPIVDLSIQAFWAGQPDQGRAACEWLLSREDLPEEIAQMTRRNQVFYSQPLADLI
ncbi:MAG: hypothetical protein ACR2J8_07260, partial [Thermomicrobiales bacterium]